MLNRLQAQNTFLKTLPTPLAIFPVPFTAPTVTSLPAPTAPLVTDSVPFIGCSVTTSPAPLAVSFAAFPAPFTGPVAIVPAPLTICPCAERVNPRNTKPINLHRSIHLSNGTHLASPRKATSRRGALARSPVAKAALGKRRMPRVGLRRLPHGGENSRGGKATHDARRRSHAHATWRPATIQAGRTVASAGRENAGGRGRMATVARPDCRVRQP